MSPTPHQIDDSLESDATVDPAARSVAARRPRRTAIAGATLAAVAVVAAALLITDHALDDTHAVPTAKHPTSAPSATLPHLTPSVASTPTQPVDPVAAALLAAADRTAAADHGTATHVDAVLTTQDGAVSALDPASGPGSSDTINVWLIDISGPTRYVCDTCFYVTGPAPSGTHVQVILVAGTYAPGGLVIDDREPDLASAGRVRHLR